MAETHKWEVIVGNVGTVYDNKNGFKARQTYYEYVRQSKAAHGRASGEPVCLTRDGEPHLEHEGTNEQD